jgi:hypothetical protein
MSNTDTRGGRLHSPRPWPTTRKDAQRIALNMALARTLLLLAGTISFFTFVAFFGRLPAFR